MKRTTSLTLILFTAALSASFLARAEPQQRTITFKPPQMGAPATRVGGGTRTIKPAMQQPAVTEQIQLLASNKSSLTASATPTLHWYASSIPPYSVEIAVQAKDKTLLKKNIGILKSAGMQNINLADYGVKLTAGQDYTWSIALIVDVNQRDKDLSANATVRYQPTSQISDIAQMKQAGYWYDAVDQSINSPQQLSDLLLPEGIAIK